MSEAWVFAQVVAVYLKPTNNFKNSKTGALASQGTTT